VNAIRSDEFFGRTRGKRELKRIETERYTLTPVKARRKLSAKKIVKPSTSAVVFTERQLQIAIAAMKGKP
jgi:hypothetical protein